MGLCRGALPASVYAAAMGTIGIYSINSWHKRDFDSEDDDVDIEWNA